MKVRTKFTVLEVAKHDEGQTDVLLTPVANNDDPYSENRLFWAATPSGRITLSISPGMLAAGLFEQGKEFYVDFSPAEG